MSHFIDDSGIKHPMLGVKIKYRYSDMEKLRLIGETKSDWVDLRAAQSYSIKKGEFTLIDLGVAMELPEGYEALVVPRSSTFKHTGLIQTNSVGVIDNSYCGPEDYWMWPCYATRDVEIEKGQRICQFRVMKNQEYILFNESDLKENENRGGHGSTGKI